MEFPYVTVCLSFLIGWLTNRAFNDPTMMDRWILHAPSIKDHRQFSRFITSGFIHASWKHLAFNLIGLLIWGHHLELDLSFLALIILFFSSMIGGNLVSFWIHRKENYSALGASGGVMGVIFGSLLITGGNVGSLFIPGAFVPSYVFGIAYLIVSYLAMKRGYDNIGHDAHIAGSITGFFTAAFISPSAIARNSGFFWTIIAFLVLALFFWFWTASFKNLFKAFGDSKPKGSARYDRYDQAMEKGANKSEIDSLLDIINKSGYHTLTPKQKERLKELSRKI